MVTTTLFSALLALTAAGPARAANLLVSHYSGFIYSLSLTPSNGTVPASLALTSTLQGGGQTPSWLTLDAASSSLFVSDESELATPDPVLSNLQVNADNSVQVVANATGSPGQVHSTLYGGADGKGFIALAQYDLSSITNYALPLTNTARPPQSLIFNMSGPGTVPSRQDKPHPHSVNLDPTGQFIVVPDLGADLLRVFLADTTTGDLTACPAAATGLGDGPRHAVFWVSPVTGATKLFVVNELGNSVSAWDVTAPAQGCLALTKTQVLSAYPANQTAPDGAKSAEIRLAGSNLYVSNRNDQTFGTQQDSVATYTIDPATGSLAFVELTNTFTFFPRTFVINKAGDLVAFGGQTSSNVAVVARDTTTGRLGPLVAQLQVGALGTVNNEDGLSSVVWNE